MYYYKLDIFKGQSSAFDITYQTQGRVFDYKLYHWEVGWKKRGRPNFFNRHQSVAISDETFFQVFDVAFQSINNT